MNQRYVGFVAAVGTAVFLCSASPAFAQPSLGAASSFAIEGAAGVTHAGGAGTIIAGDVGSSPNASITGFPPGVVTPPYGLHRNDAAAIAAQAASTALFTALSAGACSTTPVANMAGAAFTPGIHCFTSTADLPASSTMTLAGNGLYIFRVGSALTANVLSTVNFAGVDPCNVFWQVTSAATLNGATFAGNIVAQAGVSLGGGATLTGRALAINGPVTLAGTNGILGCVSSAPASTPTPGPTPPAAVCPPGGLGPVLAAIPNQSIPVNGSTTVSFTASGAVIASALGVSATSSDPTLVPQSAMVFGPPNAAGVRTLTVRSADGRSGTATISINVTDPSSGCVGTTRFVLTVGAAVEPPVPVPTLSEWAMITLTVLLALAGFAAIRKRGV